ncbi:MAG: hypothetical protein ABEK02_04485 [Haloquadratum sp.]
MPFEEHPSESGVPTDETITTPVDRDEFKVALTLRHLEIGEETDDSDPERVRRLEESRDLLRSYLAQFRQYLEPADQEAIKSRADRLSELANAAKRVVAGG